MVRSGSLRVALGLSGKAERLRCQHPASPLALKAEKNKVMIKMIEKKKLRLKEPLNSPGGEGAGQKRSGGNGRASTLGDLDLAEKGARLRQMGTGHRLP